MTTMQPDSAMILPSSPADQKIISDGIYEIVNSLTRMAAEKDQIKSITADIKDKFKIPPALMNKLARQAYDLGKKAEQDEKRTLEEEAFDLFVMGDKRLSASTVGVTAQEMEDLVKAREVKAAQIAKEEEELAKEDELKRLLETPIGEEINDNVIGKENDFVTPTVVEIDTEIDLSSAISEEYAQPVEEIVFETVKDAETVNSDIFEPAVESAPVVEETFEMPSELAVESTPVFEEDVFAMPSELAVESTPAVESTTEIDVDFFNTI